MVEVHCRCPPAEVVRRFAERAARPGHHPAHYGGAITEADVIRDFDRPMGFGTLIEVDTLATVDVRPLADRIGCIWGKAD